MIIAFCGPSGSGKSTLIKKILFDSYFDAKKISIHYEDDFLILNIAKKILGNKRFDQYNKSKMTMSTRKEDKQAYVSKIVSFFYPTIIFLEFLYLYIVYTFILKDRILLCDRYIYDYYITVRTNLGIDNKFNAFLFKQFPRPDLLFFLAIDPATSMKRNKSGSKFPITNKKSFHKTVIDEYRILSQEKRMLAINTKNDIHSSYLEIKSHIINREKLFKSREIVISGLDGVGKTTVCDLLIEYCEYLNISSKRIHFYYDNLLYKILKKTGLMKRKNIDRKMQKKRRYMNKKRRERHEIVNLFMSIVHFTDSYIQYLFFKIIYFRSILVYDRFFYDYIVSFNYYSDVKINFAMFIPHMRDKYLIINNPTIAYRRKPEIAKDFYDIGNREYVNLAKRHKFIIINANRKSPEDILNEILLNLKS